MTTTGTKRRRRSKRSISWNVVACSASESSVNSVLDGPIVDLGRLRQSLLFAELASIAYLRFEQSEQLVHPLGFDQIDFFDRDGSQAYLFANTDDCVIVCRGTEPNEWNDIKADADAVSVVAETVGRVHRGFKQEVDDLWPLIEQALVDNKKVLWFAGHSLGGAMATICAGRCFLSHIPSRPPRACRLSFYSPHSPLRDEAKRLTPFHIVVSRYSSNDPRHDTRSMNRRIRVRDSGVSWH